MTEEQATEMIELLEELETLGIHARFLLTCCALALGVIWGQLTWWLFRRGMESRRFW